MKALRMLSLVLLAWTLGLPPPALFAQTWQVAAEGLRGQELVLRPSTEGRRKVYLGAASAQDAYVLFRGDRLFPLREAEPVRVVKADPKNDRIEVEIVSTRLGKGRVDFHGTPPTPELFEQWLDEVFELRTPEAQFARYVGNRDTRVLHIRGANHLPDPDARDFHREVSDATAAGFRRCGVCFMPTPGVADYQTEQALAMMGLQQVRSTFYPHLDASIQQRVARLGEDVLLNWPVPLKGYRYRFQVVDSDEVNAFAVPTGYVFVTRGLIDALETDEELAAVLAHEIAHVESRHTYRLWRNTQRASALIGILGALSGATDSAVDDLITQMSSFAANLFLAGFGRDREREADLFASLYLHNVGKGDLPLRRSFEKLKFARDAIDPFESAGSGGLFASHPHIDDRLERSSKTTTMAFADEPTFHGLNRAGDLVAVLRLDAQRVHERDFEVVATIITTAELGRRDNINNLTVRLGSERLQLREVTAEAILPSDEVSAVFRATRASLIDEPVMGVELRLRNVEHWIPAAEAFDRPR